jgi:DNA-binding NtrC family response regulator
MPKILIVDDEPAIRSLLSMVFARAGYCVRTAADPFQAMELCGAECFDAVLSDIQMPGVDGHFLVRWVASAHPNIRAVLMSGHETNCGTCQFGCRCRLLRKPFHPNHAVALVSKMLAEPAS